MALSEFLRGFRSGFRSFGRPIGHAVNIVVLCVVYFVGVGITSVAAKAFRKRLLPLGKKESYWVQRNLGKQKMEEYKRTF